MSIQCQAALTATLPTHIPTWDFPNIQPKTTMEILGYLLMYLKRIQQADVEKLFEWGDQMLVARTIEEGFH